MNLEKVYEKMSRKNKVYTMDIIQNYSVVKSILNQARGTETEVSLQRRLEAAKTDLEYAEKPGYFDLGRYLDTLIQVGTWIL